MTTDKFYMIYTTKFNIHNYEYSIPSECNYHILYWSVDYFLSRIAPDGKLHKDSISYLVKYHHIHGGLESLIQTAKKSPMRQIALSFRSCPSLQSLVLVKLGNK